MILETMLLTGIIIGGMKYWTRDAAQEEVRKKKASLKNTDKNKREMQVVLGDDQIEKHLALTGVSTVLVGVGVLSSPVITIAGLLFFLPPVIFVLKRARHNFIEERKLTLEAYETVLAPGLLLGGYYFTACLSYFLYVLSLKILSEIKDSSRRNIIDFHAGFTDKVWIVKDGVEIEVPFRALQKGDVISVKGGEIIPADGIIVYGYAAVDQHILTGEALAVEKKVGDLVFSSTIVQSGTIHFRVEQSGKETVAANIANILNNTVDYKTDKETIGEKVAGQAILPTFALASLAYPITGSIGALAVMASYIGADAQIFIPLSALNFMKASSLNGILIKDGRSLEYLAKVDTVIFDKTGTLTTEDLAVEEIYLCDEFKKKDILGFAALAEKRQTHPIAKAILKEAEDWGINTGNADDICYEAGFGIKVQTPDHTIHAGSERFMAINNIEVPPSIQFRLQDCADRGASLILIALHHKIAGAIELRITIRPEVKNIINYLKKKKKSLYMITGDTQNSATAMADELGIDHYFSETFPEQKAEIVDKFLAEGRTICYIGDGINDSIAMKKAQVAISLGGASSIARDTAGIILMDGTLRNINKLFEIGAYFGTNVNNALALAIVPGLLNMASVFSLNTGIYFALFLYYVSLPLNLANSFNPLFKFAPQKSDRILLTGRDHGKQ